MALLEKAKAADSNEALANVLGWSGAELSTREITVGNRAFALGTAKIEGQGAVIFAKLDDRASTDELNAISLFSYHS